MAAGKCDRCAKMTRVRRYRIDDAYESAFCEPCAKLTSQYHEIELLRLTRAEQKAEKAASAATEEEEPEAESEAED